MPSKNKMVEIIGKPHKYLTFFPPNTPMKIEYIGSTTKNSKKQTAIAASPFIKVTANHGNNNIITIETKDQRIKSFFIIL